MVGRVATTIKRIIKSKGLKQKSVAERAGIPEKKFSDMLTGRAMIQACYIPAIANALEVTPNEIFEIAP